MNKELFLNEVLRQKDELFNITKDLYNNPEIGKEEFKSSSELVKYLQKEGFKTTYPYIMETGFLGVYEGKKEGPKIGFLCEYDALPVVGHGCGHNLICTMSIGAAVALKSKIDEIGGSIYVFGTPAEENFGGKVQFARAHAFDNIDVALMLHPSGKNGLGSKSMAIIPLKFDFYGKSAHGCHPYTGASALDAAVQTYQGINMLRQFIKQPSFIHGIIRDGGGAANVIPEHASLEYYFRSDKYDYCKELSLKGEQIAKSAAQMCGCTVTSSMYEEEYEDTLINYKLAEGLKEAFQTVGLCDIREVVEIPSGSTDVGAVSKVCPTIQGDIKIVDESVNFHTKEVASATVSPAGEAAIVNGSLSLALLAYKYITDKEYQKAVWDEFKGQ